MDIILPNFFLFGLMALAVVVVVVAVRASHAGRRSSTALARRECPACKEPMRRDASLCPSCRTPSEPWSYHDGRWWVVRPDGSYYLDDWSQTWTRVDPGPDAPP